MNATIESMVEEHNNIERLLNVIRKICIGILDGNPVPVSDLRLCIQTARSFDKFHHGKEEDILFKEMTKHLGAIGENLVTHGMLVEHDQCRLYIMELEEGLNQYEKNPTTDNKLDLLTAASEYAITLQRHINKENSTVYTFAERRLPPESLEYVRQETERFNEQTRKDNIPQTIMGNIKDLEQRYMK